MTSDVEVLLDGLAVGSLTELRRLVDRGRDAERIDGSLGIIGDQPCPDCLTPWPIQVSVCPACGLTFEGIAERIAR